MTIQTVNLGTYANDSTGDDLRTAFTKVNDNTAELDLTRVVSAENLGLGAAIFKDKVNKNLQLRKINAGINISVTQNANDITIAAPDSINNLVEDTSPQLGGNLDLNNFNIVGTGNIEVEGVVIADEFTGNLVVKDSSLTIEAYNSATFDYNIVSVNGLIFSGNNRISSGVNNISTSMGDGLVISSDLQLVLASTNGVLVDSDLDVTGIITGNLIGNVTGNVTGTVSSIANHNLEDLANVAELTPTVGQALTWNGSFWTPSTIVIPPTGVTRILAGSNISISPSNGLGDVTINSTATGGAGGDLDFGSFTTPSGFTLDLGSF